MNGDKVTGIDIYSIAKHTKPYRDIDSELNFTIRKTTLQRSFNIGLLQERMRTHMYHDLCSEYNMDAVTCKMYCDSNVMECLVNERTVKQNTQLKHNGLVLLRTTTIGGSFHNFVLICDNSIGHIFDPNGQPSKRIFTHHIENLKLKFGLRKIITYNGPNFNQRYPHLKQINHIKHKGYCLYINFYFLFLILRMRRRVTPIDIYGHICNKFKTKPDLYQRYLLRESEKIVCYALEKYYS